MINLVHAAKCYFVNAINKIGLRFLVYYRARELMRVHFASFASDDQAKDYEIIIIIRWSSIREFRKEFRENGRSEINKVASLSFQFSQ